MYFYCEDLILFDVNKLHFKSYDRMTFKLILFLLKVFDDKYD